MSEDRILLQVSITQALDRLNDPETRDMVALYYEIIDPDDYVGPWPPTFVSVGEYVGEKYGDGPVAESTIRYRMRQVLVAWREEGIL